MHFGKAAAFIWENGRLLERRLFEYYFLGGSKDGVLRALKAYQNEDGGFGHALEPDLRTPESQPLFVEFGLRTLYEAGIRDEELALRDFAPVPDSYCRKLFRDAAIHGHLEALEAQQEEDGGWPISWEPPGGTAGREWRSHRTLRALVTLASYRKAIH